jgi:hypothetical protein
MLDVVDVPVPTDDGEPSDVVEQAGGNADTTSSAT